MKIIFATESYPPSISGVAVATFLLAKSTAEAGHEVWIFAPEPAAEYAHVPEPTIKNLHIERFRSMSNPFRGGHRVSFLPKKAVTAAFHRIKPDLVHLQDPNGISAAVLKAAEVTKTPVVITNHFAPEFVMAYLWFLGPFKPLAKKKLLSYIKEFYNKSKIIITPTQTIADMVSSWGLEPPVRAISNGITAERFAPGKADPKVYEEFKIPTDKPIVLYLGRIDRDKSVPVIVEAMPEVLKKHDVHFVLAGSGDMRTDCMKMAQKAGVADHLTLTGPIAYSSDILPNLYRTASLFVIPSTIETQSLVTLEAMACGLPVVGAKAGALTELIQDGENGYLFEPENASDCAKKIIKFFDEPEKHASMSKMSQKQVEPHHLTAVHQEVLDLYEKILASSRS